MLRQRSDDLDLVATLEDLEDPINTSDRAPLTGNITSTQAQQNTRAAHNTQGYLNSVLPGEDRRAPLNTLDESVWDTLKRDLLAVWEKMRQVLYPKYLLGGAMTRGSGMGGLEGGAGANTAGAAGTLEHIRGLVGRWPDADLVLQGGMSDGLRDWDLWYVALEAGCVEVDSNPICLQGSATVLSSAILVLERQCARGSTLVGLQRCLCNDLARRSTRDATDQAAGRKYVGLRFASP